MSRTVFDASAALAFVFQDEPKHAAAVELVRALAAQNVTLCAPALFAYEVDSVIRLRVWKGTLSEDDAATARAIIDALAVEIEYDESDRERAFQIARDYEQPRVYDASYAAHAQSRGFEMVTTDKPFFEGVSGSKKPKTVPPLLLVKLLS